jgi:peptide chain release factor 3
LLPAFDRAGLPARRDDADLVRLGHQFLRRQGTDGRDRRYGPEPQPQRPPSGRFRRRGTPVTGFVFKVQANMDPKHRDRVAFVRLASGHFERGMKLFACPVEKADGVTNPVLFLAADRELAEEAWAGDIIGIPNHGQLRIGDALTEGEALRFTGIPSFAPELLQIHPRTDPMKAKHLEKALMQFAEEGAAKVFKPMIGSGFIVGVVGALQFEVLASRIEQEYPARAVRRVELHLARWISGDKGEIEKLVNVNKQHIATDSDGDLVFLTRLQWDIDRVVRDYPGVKLTATKEMMA